MTREEYLLKESKAFLDKNYYGSIVKMITAFNGGEKLEKDEIARLKQLFFIKYLPKSIDKIRDNTVLCVLHNIV